MSLSLNLPDPRLEGGGFVLRAWRMDDANEVVTACTDPDTQRFIPVLPSPYTVQDAAEFIAGAAESLADGSAINLAVADSASDRLLGAITLHTGSEWHWYVGYWTTPAARGRGITSGALTSVTRWAFASYASLDRISLYTDPDNAASQRVAEKAGFEREGVLRHWDRAAGYPQDIVMFSLLRSDLDR